MAIGSGPEKSLSATELVKCRAVGIGELEVARAPQRLRAVLGSCVGTILFDPTTKTAAMAHSILPIGEEPAAEPGKYANQAVDHLVDRLVEAGARKTRLVAKLVGGAQMFGSGTTPMLGDRNIEAARARLGHHGIAIVGEAVGGTKGRRLMVDCETGRVDVEIIGQSMTTI